MDTIKQFRQLAGKYKYVALVILAGLALMLLPGPKKSDPRVSTPEAPAEVTMTESLEQILSRIHGVGRVQVLLTEAQGSRTVYVFDEHSTADSSKTDAVILTDGNRTQMGMVSQVIPPVYLGAVIVCQGGDDPTVKLSVVEAVCDATGLSADRITVLKMK